MTRFNITLKQAIEVVKYSINNALGGEIFIPKMPSYTVKTVAEAIDKNIDIKITEVGLRKKHEELFHEHDCINLLETSDLYVISSILNRNNYIKMVKCK